MSTARRRDKYVKIQRNVNQLAATAMAAVLAIAHQAVTVTATANKICDNNQPAATAVKIRLCGSVGNRAGSSVGNSASTASGDSEKQQSMDRIETTKQTTQR